ncbi:hypothetical protein Tco_0457190, partial [Tanacetum coccineum]
IYESESTRFSLQGSKALFSNPNMQDSDSDIEEDQRSSSEFLANLTPQLNQSINNNQKDYKVKYKGLKAEIVVLTKKIDAMNKGKSEKGLVAE